MIEVSVIIPSYKPGNYIFECLESLLAQTLSKDRFEIIVVLNGCNEPFYSCIRAFIKDTKCLGQIILLQTDVSGVSNARNLGLNEASGNYICFVDDDDVLTPNYIEKLLQVISNDSIAVSNVYSFEESIEAPIKDYLTMVDNVSNGIIRDRKYLSNACCKLIPKQIIGNRRFNSNFKNGEDALFMFQLSDKIRYINKASLDCIYYRRLRVGSASRRNRSLVRQLYDIIQQQWMYTRFFLSNLKGYSWILYFTRILAVLKTLKL
ncbi:MAG: glycosyltransferase family 2 protein [Bacteroides sp.]|nr:glycosyltransferase family 2 protein [Bacteroides sp.]